MIGSNELCVEVTKSPFKELGPPKLYVASGSGLLCIGITKCPCGLPRVQAISGIQRLLESIALRLTLPKLHLAT